MEEFIIDLMELFKKHGIVVIKDSIELSSSPLHIDGYSKLKSRDLVFKFTEVVKDDDEAVKHSNKYGFIVKMN